MARNRDEALFSPMIGDEWRGPVVKILVLEVRDILDEEQRIVFCAAHKDHEFKRQFTRSEPLGRFIDFVGNGELVAAKEGK